MAVAIVVPGGDGRLSAGISTQGNTSGTTGFATDRLLLVGGNNVTLSQSINAGSVTLTISVPAFPTVPAQFTGGFSTQGNTSGNTGMVTGQLILVGGNSITLSGSTNAGSITVTISAATVSGPRTLSEWVNQFAGVLTSQGTSNATMTVFPLCVDLFPGVMTASTIRVFVTASVTATASSSSHSSTISIGFYTYSSLQLSLLFSASTTWALAAATGNTNSYHGLREISFHSSLFNVAPAFSESRYWVGLWARGNNLAMPVSIVGQVLFLEAGTVRSGGLGVAANTAASCLGYPAAGRFSASFTTALPNAISVSDLLGSVQNVVPIMHFNNWST